MPSFGSSDSPSLRKMEMNNNGRFGGGSERKFNMGHILGDPFSLATISIAMVGAYTEVSTGGACVLTACSAAG